MNRIFSLFFLLLLSGISFAQTKAVKISGIAPEYAGQKIELLMEANPIGEPSIISSFNILPDGSFETTALISQTCYCYAKFDRWVAGIYLEPGNTYQISFPPFRPLSEAEKQNPFFSSDEILFGIKNAQQNDINRKISLFESTFNKTESQYFDQIFKRKSAAAADSMINKLNRLFPTEVDPFFERYKSLRLASVRFALNQGHTGNFVKNYLDLTPLNFNLPPYKQLFEQFFTNFFDQESNQINGSKFRTYVGTANLAGIENYLTKTKGWSTELSRMVILKGIHDAYYQQKFPSLSMFRLLDQIEASTWPTREKKLARELQEKLRYLMVGTQAPSYSTQKLGGQKLQLSDFAGKLVLLHFTSATNPICRQHLDEIRKINENFQSKIVIINMIPESNIAKKDLILQQNWPGTFAIATEEILDKYRVKTFPSTYLVDEKGQLILSPALNPLDGLGQQLGDYFKQKQLNQLRNQPR